jgi:hypothetical protein
MQINHVTYDRAFGETLQAALSNPALSKLIWIFSLSPNVFVGGEGRGEGARLNRDDHNNAPHPNPLPGFRGEGT